jgi:hypothetical protein
VKSANFPLRPDSVIPGSLLGPFEGQVIDASNQLPIAGAEVWCSWSFDRGIGNVSPQGVRSYTGKTSIDGHYRIPALRDLPSGLTTRLIHFSLIIYKKGYVAYRNNETFSLREGPSKFSQLNQVIQLSRWSPELLHSRHLFFIGNGDSLVKASQWEIAAAVAELNKQPMTATSEPKALGSGITPQNQREPVPTGFNTKVLLSPEEVRAITGYSGEFIEGRLKMPATANFDTLHLRAKDKPESYDVALRVWLLKPNELVPKYEELLNALPGSKQNDEIADRSFVVLQGDILGLGFMDRSASTVILLTCGRSQCADNDQLIRLGEQVEKNLNRLEIPKTESGSPTPNQQETGEEGDNEDESP